MTLVQTRNAFHLWSRIHRDILDFLALVPEGSLDAKAPGFEQTLGDAFRHVATVEDYWRRAVLDPGAEYRALDAATAPDATSLRAALEQAFAGIERLLDASLVDAMYERPVKSRYPVRNALEALTLCHLHTVHHRAGIAAHLRALGIAVEDWI